MHIPVLLEEVTKQFSSLKSKSEKIIVDCTFGNGGHSKDLVEKFDNIKVYGFEIDKQLKQTDYATLINSNFANIQSELSMLGVDKVDGILADLGFSSDQISKIGIYKDVDLDLRFDENLGVTAKDLLVVLGEKELGNLFYKYSEEPLSRHIAAEICKFRKHSPISKNFELSEIITEVVKKSSKNKHKANRTHQRIFQALRIAVNHEYSNLQKLITDGAKLLNKGGIFTIISFHSGEDRIVKTEFNNLTKNENFGWHSKLIKPTEAEVKLNKRSRSALLRSVIKNG